jgi:hypothetical protein
VTAAVAAAAAAMFSKRFFYVDLENYLSHQKESAAGSCKIINSFRNSCN